MPIFDQSQRLQGLPQVGQLVRTALGIGGRAIRAVATAVNNFVANTATFDGTTQHIALTSAPPVGIADGGAFTASFWVKFDVDGTRVRIQGTNNNRWQIERTTGNLINVLGINTGATTVLDISTTSQVTVSSGWVHVYICVDLNQAQANTKIYLNGVSDTLTYTTFTAAGVIDMANTIYRIGASAASTNRLDGALAEWWIDDVYFDDPTKFASGGKPISLGANGQTPTGSAPAIYLSLNGSGDSWATDSSGNGNNFTVTGSPLGSTTPP